jgi:long-chain acyl-CoA synthetase
MSYYDRLEQYGADTAIITESSESISYAALASAADSLCERVVSRRVGFLVCENRFESIAGYLGFLRRRAVPLLISSRMDADLLDDLIAVYRPAYLYMSAARASTMQGYRTLARCKDYCLLEADHVQDVEVDDELALLLTTSGSTGSPKLVRLSYKNIGSNAEAIAEYLAISGSDRPITTMPMSYTFGLSIINSHLLRGASIVLTESTLMDKRFWELLKTQDATTFSGVPYTYEMLKKLRFANMHLPSLQYVTQAGGKLSRELVAEFVEVCEAKGMRFIVMYGQTEATARMSYLPWEFAHTKTGSIGVAIPGGRFWLVDDASKIIDDDDTVGELYYQGDNVSLGYATSLPDLSKGDENKGVLQTGDMAKRDSDGFYYIVGRKKRFLKLFGNRVNLDEVELLLRAEGYECACAGVDDKLTIYATVSDKQDHILKVVSERTGINPAGFAVVYVEELPRNESGKTVYSALG